MSRLFRRSAIAGALYLLLSPTAEADDAVASASPAAVVDPSASLTSGEAEDGVVPEIIVTADPLARAADDFTRPVVVINGDALARQLAPTIGETLERQLGVSTTDFGRGAGRPIIRGQGGPRVLVMENGIATMDASDVSTDHDVGIDPAQARQVEILKGPATLIYGSAASAGVVNVVNGRLPDSVTPGFAASASSGYGSNGDERYGSAEFGYGFGRTQLHADIAGRKAGDYDIAGAANRDGSGSRGSLANSDTRKTSGSFSAGHIWETGSVAASFSRVLAQYGLPVEEAAFIDMSQSREDLELKLDQPLPGVESLRLRGGYNDYEHVEFEEPGVPGTRFENQQGEARLEVVHTRIAGWHGVVGLQYGHRDFAAIGDESFVPATVSQQLGVFAIENRAVPWGQIEIGLRVDRNRNNPDALDAAQSRRFTPMAASFGSTVELSEDYHLKFYATQSQRAPVTEELYSFGPHGATSTFERGDDALGKETARNIEIGIDRHNGRLQWRANVYYEHIQDYVFQQEADEGLNADGSGLASSDGVADRVDDEGQFADDGELLLVRYAQANARFYGVEGEVAYALLDGPTRLDARLFGDIAQGELRGGADLPRMTPARLGVGLQGTRGRWSGGLDLLRIFDQQRTASLESSTPGYSLLNADLRYEIPADKTRTTIFLRGRNLLDENARRHTSFIKDQAPLPGINALIGLDIALF